MTLHDRDRNPMHPEGLTGAQEFLAEQLFEIGAVQFGGFRLKLHDKYPEAPLSPVYFDFRVLPIYPKVLSTVADVYRQLAERAEPYDAVLGIPDAGVPLATALSLKSNDPQIVMRKTEKTGHGIEGQFLTPIPNDITTVLLVDDLMTTAASKEEAIAKLKIAGLEVADVIVLLDRNQDGKGKARLAESGVSSHAAFTMGQLLDYYARTGKITIEQYRDIRSRLAELSKFLQEKAS